MTSNIFRNNNIVMRNTKIYSVVLLMITFSWIVLSSRGTIYKYFCHIIWGTYRCVPETRFQFCFGWLRRPIIYLKKDFYLQRYLEVKDSFLGQMNLWNYLFGNFKISKHMCVFTLLRLYKNWIHYKFLQ